MHVRASRWICIGFALMHGEGVFRRGWHRGKTAAVGGSFRVFVRQEARQNEELHLS